MKTLANFSLLILLYLCSVSCATNPVTGRSELMLLSQEDEKALGKQSDEEIVASMGVYEDEELLAFIQSTGQKMAAASHRPELGYTFRIIDSPVINAFALPGGYVYFTRGILAYFNNEAEFAGVLGHEIGHITARHSAKQYSKAVLAQGGLTVGTILSPEFRKYQDIAAAGTSLLFLKFGRDAERQSDKLGVEYSTNLGFDAREMVNFFSMLENVQENSGQTIPDFLSTHPDPGERRVKVQEMAEKIQTENATYAINRNEYLDMLDGLVYGEDPRQGFVENNTFYHPDLGFRFTTPSKWSVLNSPAMVQMSPEDQKAMMQFTIRDAGSSEEVIQSLVKNYQLTLTDTRRFNANKKTFTEARFVQESEEQTIGGSIIVTPFNGAYYLFIGIALDENYSGYRETVLKTATSLDVVKEPAILNRTPARIRIKTVSSSATLESHLKSYGISEDYFREISLMNAIPVNEVVEAGSKIKIVISNDQTSS